jgi:hypothetical protein
LLSTLDAKPLSVWEDWVVAVPARMRQAREQAARLLEPKTVRVRPKSTTLRTLAETDAYLSDLRAEIAVHIEAGNPVLM